MLRDDPGAVAEARAALEAEEADENAASSVDVKQLKRALMISEQMRAMHQAWAGEVQEFLLSSLEPRASALLDLRPCGNGPLDRFTRDTYLNTELEASRAWLHALAVEVEVATGEAAEDVKRRVLIAMGDAPHLAAPLLQDQLVKAQAEVVELRAASRWIPATERLPDPHTEGCPFSSEVLVCYWDEESALPLMACGHYTYGLGRWQIDGNPEIVAHLEIFWMSKPTPPEPQVLEQSRRENRDAPSNCNSAA